MHFSIEFAERWSCVLSSLGSSTNQLGRDKLELQMRTKELVIDEGLQLLSPNEVSRDKFSEVKAQLELNTAAKGNQPSPIWYATKCGPRSDVGLSPAFNVCLF